MTTDAEPTRGAERTCSKCAGSIWSDDQFCARCGTRVARPCAFCGTLMFASDAYCPSCGEAPASTAQRKKPNDFARVWRSVVPQLRELGARVRQLSANVDRRWVYGGAGVIAIGFAAWGLATLGSDTPPQVSPQPNVAVAPVDTALERQVVDSFVDTLPITATDSVRLSISNLPKELFVSDSVRLSLRARRGPASIALSDPVRWTSTNTGVARVDPNGRIVALAEGDATIIASSGALQTRSQVRVIRRAPVAPVPTAVAPAETTKAAPVDSLAELFRIPQNSPAQAAQGSVSESDVQSVVGLIKELFVSRRHRRLAELYLNDVQGDAAMRDRLVERISRAAKVAVRRARADAGSQPAANPVQAHFEVVFDYGAAQESWELELLIHFESDARGGHRLRGFRIANSPAL